MGDLKFFFRQNMRVSEISGTTTKRIVSLQTVFSMPNDATGQLNASSSGYITTIQQLERHNTFSSPFIPGLAIVLHFQRKFQNHKLTKPACAATAAAGAGYVRSTCFTT